jgi:hypothetical protein
MCNHTLKARAGSARQREVARSTAAARPTSQCGPVPSESEGGNFTETGGGNFTLERYKDLWFKFKHFKLLVLRDDDDAIFEELSLCFLILPYLIPAGTRNTERALKRWLGRMLFVFIYLFFKKDQLYLFVTIHYFRYGCGLIENDFSYKFIKFLKIKNLYS